MNIAAILIQTLGGLGLFILGMKLMTDGLQATAGQRIRRILEAISSNRFMGFLTGAGVTAIVQSSSATSVMLVGFVSAGIMSFQQAVGVIIGSNVGTTITGQLIAFNLSEAALPAIALGVALKYFSKKRNYRYINSLQPLIPTAWAGCSCACSWGRRWRFSLLPPPSAPLPKSGVKSLKFLNLPR